MTVDLLDPSALISSLPSLLPPSKKRLESTHDAITALLHTVLIALAFRLVAVDDSSPANPVLNGVLPEAWNRHGPGNYTLRYRHEQSSLEFVVKVVKLGSRTLVNAIAVESDKAASLDISTDDFVSPSFFPYNASTDDAQPLVHGFISSNRIVDLVGQFKLKIIQKLMPGLHKEGYTEDTGDSSGARRESPPENNPAARPRPESPPFAPDRPFNLPAHLPPQNPLEIGRRDLDPLGLGSNPFAPPSLFPGSGGDGMLVGPNHPIFGQRGQRGGPIRGPWGGDGYLPSMGAPPGARFDPVGPGMGPFPGRGGLNPRGGLPGGGNMFGPDNDEFMPPGAVSPSSYNIVFESETDGRFTG
ncbi:PI31 proteasome regulator N-terminal-domain-containing protein [Amylostereum chailletii]|nr:PI31 proteasome regulator N-terminal-domain-containing protein [Amylostereum chailletii]